MADQVELRVKSGLKAVLDDMDALRAKVQEVNTSFKSMGDDTAESVKSRTKETETFFSNLRNFGRRVSDQLKRDFKALASVESLTAGLKLSEQFKNSITETVSLANAIRKLGATFGIASNDFASFQKEMTQGLGDIGLSSDVATRSLEGLSTTQVRGQKPILEYSKTSGQLASIGREQGREGDIARSIANVLKARGTDQNNLGEMNALAESVRRITIQTGVQPTKVLSDMERLFAEMPADLRKSISSSGLANLSAAQAVGGPNATKFIEEYLGKSPIARLAFDAQGGRGVFNDQGIDIEKFKSFAQSIMGRVGGDPRLAAQTLGLSEEAAEGFVRLAESLDRVKDAQDRIQKSTGSLNESYQKSMGLGESFRANINRVKGNLSGLLENIIQGGTDALSGASKSDAGSAAVVAGGGLLAAILTGGGLRGLGAGIMGSVAKGAIAEQVTGEKVQPVYVVNAAEIGLGTSALSAGGGLLGTAGKWIGGLGLAAGGAYLAGKGMESLREKTGYSAQTEKEAIESVGGQYMGIMYEQLYNLLVKMNNGVLGTNYSPLQREQTVKVELNTRQLKATTKPSVGAQN